MGGSASIGSKEINMFGHDGLMGSNGPIGVGACFATNKPTIVFLGDAAAERLAAEPKTLLQGTVQLSVVLCCQRPTAGRTKK